MNSQLENTENSPIGGNVKLSFQTKNWSVSSSKLVINIVL